MWKKKSFSIYFLSCVRLEIKENLYTIIIIFANFLIFFVEINCEMVFHCDGKSVFFFIFSFKPNMQKYEKTFYLSHNADKPIGCSKKKKPNKPKRFISVIHPHKSLLFVGVDLNDEWLFLTYVRSVSQIWLTNYDQIETK